MRAIETQKKRGETIGGAEDIARRCHRCARITAMIGMPGDRSTPMPPSFDSSASPSPPLTRFPSIHDPADSTRISRITRAQWRIYIVPHRDPSSCLYIYIYAHIIHIRLVGMQLKIAPFPRYVAHRTVQPQTAHAMWCFVPRPTAIYIKIIATAARWRAALIGHTCTLYRGERSDE